MIIYTVGQKPVLKQIGGKAYNLAHLSNISVNVPKWFALTSICFDDFIYEHREEYCKLLDNYSEANRKKIIKLIESTDFSDDTKKKVLAQIAKTFDKKDLLFPYVLAQPTKTAKSIPLLVCLNLICM